MFVKFATLLLAGVIGFGATTLGGSDSSVRSAYDIPVVEQVAMGSTVSNVVPVNVFSRDKHENQGSICINNRTRDHYVGELVSREEVLFWASKYWDGWNLEVAAAITVKEGQRDLNCIGDDVKPYYNVPTADGRHWGESVGLYQYRTIIEQTGKGGCDDINYQLGNIERQTECAYSKYVGRNNTFRPWSMYTNGKYKGAIGK